jgi:hypothetical protein
VHAGRPHRRSDLRPRTPITGISRGRRHRRPVSHELAILPPGSAGATLDSLVENTGRINFNKERLSDTGLLHALLDVRSDDHLHGHPKVGASWEGFAIAAVVDRLQAHWSECFFWATHAGAELDLLVVRGRTRLGFEIKRMTAPLVTPSMRIALHDLKLARLDVLHAGTDTFPLAPKIRAVALSPILRDVRPLGWTVFEKRAVRCGPNVPQRPRRSVHAEGARACG